MAILTRKYPPGDFGIWLVIYIELITFGAFFISYAFTRRMNTELFNSSQALLNKEFGFVNTLALISSSFLVVKTIEVIKSNEISEKIAKASNYLLVSIFLGGLFLILKCIEFYQKFSEGINLSTNKFFMFYFIMTSFHFLHVVLGVFILVVLYKNTKNNLYTKTNYKGLETGASYWHMVDLVWIILFPLIYIMR
jgi:nitric oxide reductase NorE protein